MNDPFWVPNPVRDAQAIQLAQSAIAALGGAAPIGQIQSYTVQAQETLTDGNSTKVGNIVWQVSGSQYQSELSGPGVTNRLSTGNGSPFRVLNGSTQRLSDSILRAAFVPALVGSVLLQAINNTNYSLQYGGTGVVGTINVAIVKISSQATRSDSFVTPQTWYFDASTGLPVQIDYRLPGQRDFRGSFPATVDLSAYSAVGSVLYPLQSVATLPGGRTISVQVASITANPTIPASTFAAPAGGVQ